MKVKDLTGRFKAAATLDSEFVLENRQDIVDDITAQIEAQGGNVKLVDNCLEIEGGCQYFKLPVLPRERCGVIEFKSKDFHFIWVDAKGVEHRTVCSKPKAKDMTPDGFKTTNLRGDVTTWVLTS